MAPPGFVLLTYGHEGTGAIYIQPGISRVTIPLAFKQVRQSHRLDQMQRLHIRQANCAHRGHRIRYGLEGLSSGAKPARSFRQASISLAQPLGGGGGWGEGGGIMKCIFLCNFDTDPLVATNRDKLYSLQPTTYNEHIKNQEPLKTNNRRKPNN